MEFFIYRYNTIYMFHSKSTIAIVEFEIEQTTAAKKKNENENK